MTDIQNRGDLVKLLDAFYSRAVKDAVIGEKFDGLKMDDHIETIADFWDSILFGKFKYQGNPFLKHIPLGLKKEDFDQWIVLFHQTIDAMFEGVNSEEAKTRASTIAKVFQFKIESLGQQAHS
jgi:hemoglobin